MFGPLEIIIVHANENITIKKGRCDYLEYTRTTLKNSLNIQLLLVFSFYFIKALVNLYYYFITLYSFYSFKLIIIDFEFMNIRDYINN